MSEDAETPAALLDRAEQAHRSGHFAAVRAILRQLDRTIERTGGRTAGLSSEEAERARALRDRLRPDPLVAVLIVACLVLFVAVVAAHWH